MQKTFKVGDKVMYRYEDTFFVGTVIAKGYKITDHPYQRPDDMRYMIQQSVTGIIHVYGPKYLDWMD